MSPIEPHPRPAFGRLIALGLLLVALAVGSLRLHKDSSIEALVPVSDPVFEHLNLARQVFGQTDPMAIAIAAPDAAALMSPQGQALLARLVDDLARVPGVDPETVRSLLSETWVDLDADDSLQVRPLLRRDLAPEQAVRELDRALAATPEAIGRMISPDRSAALVLCEMRRNAASAEVYVAIRELVATLPVPPGFELHIAGEAAVGGFLSTYIDQDSRRLTPLAAVLMLLLLIAFLRRRSALVLGGFVLGGTLAATVGAMGWSGVPFYIITSSLPAILLSVSIADTVHLLGRYQRLRAEDTDASSRDCMQAALKEQWAPMALTSLTTAFGFIGLALGSDLPPLREYGLYASLGVAVAWVLTVFGLPVLVEWLDSRRGPRPVPVPAQSGLLGRAGDRLADAVSERPGLVLALITALVLAAALGVQKLEFNEERIRNFAEGSPMFQADAVLNQRFDGTHYLDLHLEVPEGRSLLEPELIQRLADLQDWMRGAGGFVDAGSYLDVLGAVRRSLNADSATAWPDNQAEAEQLLFVYEASAAPGVLGDQLTADRRQAYVRGFLRTNNYQSSRPLIEAFRNETERRFTGTGVETRVTGQVAVLASWVGPLFNSTLLGLLGASAMIFLVSAIALRSLSQGLLCVVPVSMAVLAVFGLMGHLGIWLSVATSMFASITLGLGVDFAIHVMFALRRARDRGLHGVARTRAVYRDIGAPLMINLLTLVCGFSVTLLSSIPAVRSFGLLVSAGVIGSFIGACLILPALHALATRRALPHLDDKASLESSR